MNDFVEFRRVIGATLRWAWLLVVITAVAAVVTFAFTRTRPKVYQATSMVLVGDYLHVTHPTRADVDASQALTHTYAEMATQQPVLQGVVDALHLPVSWRDLGQRVFVDPVPNTSLLRIEVQAGSAAQATDLANEVAHQLVLRSPSAATAPAQADYQAFVRTFQNDISSVSGDVQSQMKQLRDQIMQSGTQSKLTQVENQIDALVSGVQTHVQSWQQDVTKIQGALPAAGASNALDVVMGAQADPAPVRPRTYLDTLIGGVLGFLLALALVFVLEYRDDAIRSSADAGSWLGLPVLGAIDRIPGKLPRARVLTSAFTSSPSAEAYRIIRSAIAFSTGARSLHSLVVTSPGSGDGRSLTAANLAIIMARGGTSTVLVDADLRNPVQHDLFGVSNARGLTDAVRSGEADLDNLLFQTEEPGLQLLTSGEPNANAADLLTSQRMREVLAALERRADMVILDSPAALGLTDAGVLAHRADGVLMVVKAGGTHLTAARQALTNLRQAHANVIGLVLNRGRAENVVAVLSSTRKTLPGVGEVQVVQGQEA